MKTDRLQKIVEEQYKFTKGYQDPSLLTEQQKLLLAREYLLCAYEELSELGLAVKNHTLGARRVENKDVTFKINENVDQRKQIQEEIVDVFKYILNIGFCYGLDDKILYQQFRKKSKINRVRRKEANKFKEKFKQE